ncbi:MAG: M14 family metallopeptidase [Candidatus Vogelbacteria bacterium]|nr:M14 family metallopeptidase [Candidatus Vogelbacteria bacterium]
MRFTPRTIFVVVFLLLIVGGGFLFWRGNAPKATLPPPPPPANPDPRQQVIGTSVEGRKIEADTFGSGGATLLFVGGIHGGYEWNSVLLANQFIDYLKSNPTLIPEYLTVTVVPDANPDGVFKVIGKEGRFTLVDVPTTTATAAGRFNANGVDLNRNFACNWKPQSTWQNKTVSAGTASFSEPEAAAIRDLVLAVKPAAVIFWHSQSGTVYASQCKNGILPATLEIMNAYAKAAKYKTDKSFDSYAITGDAEGWLASIGIPAITVELQTHNTIEWEQNLSGVKALFGYFRPRNSLPNN